MRRFVAVGCSSASSTPEAVGQARIPADGLAETLRRLAERLNVREAVYLATCHRTEWFLVYEGEMCAGRLLMAISRALPELTSGASRLPVVEQGVALQGDQAARHLLRVTCGLESLMVGENQILGQVKAAFHAAQAAGLAGPFIATFFAQAFQAAKQVRTLTSLGRRPVSLVSLAERVLEARLSGDPRAVAVLGAGEMAGLALELVRKIDPARPVVVYNRGSERGAALAARFGGRFHALSSFPAAGETYAAVIGAAATAAPLIDSAAATRLSPALLLDLATPGNVDGTCGDVAGVEVVDQAALSRVADENRAARTAEIGHAEAIIEEHLEALGYEVMERDLGPVARSLLQAFKTMAHEELARVGTASVTIPEDQIEAVAERLSRRLLRVPMRGLREIAWQHSTAVLSTFLAAVER